jgi:hypothetical protein
MESDPKNSTIASRRRAQAGQRRLSRSGHPDVIAEVIDGPQGGSTPS